MDLYNETRNKRMEQLGRRSVRTLKKRAFKNKLKGYMEVGFSHVVKHVSRRDWAAAAPRPSTGYLCKPATHVRLTTTRSDFCTDKEGCTKIIHQLQDYHMRNGLCDIPYNFMIGGDFSIYEGRGYLWNPLLKEEYGELEGKIFDIALIGTFQDRDPSVYLMSLALDLINACILKKYLIPKFELISFPECREPTLPLNLQPE